MTKYRYLIKEEHWKENNSAVLLMGWCRGRLSEGIDFSDEDARLVCVIGIPNPQISAP